MLLHKLNNKSIYNKNEEKESNLCTKQNIEQIRIFPSHSF